MKLSNKSTFLPSKKVSIWWNFDWAKHLHLLGKELYEMIRKISFFFFEGEEKYPLDYFKAKSVIIQLSHLVIFKECVYDSNLFFP